MNLFKKVFGDSNDREIARLQKVVQRINAMEADYQKLDDAALSAKTDEFCDRYDNGESLDDLLPEAFAAIREASRRTIGLRHYDVQLIGGMILHKGRVAEMRTGEGKTLVATLPLYLNALAGNGVHLVTPNDYLAKVGAQWMGAVYHALGVSVGVIQSGMGVPDKASFIYDPTYISADDRYQYLRPVTRKEAYLADITYGTNNEFGFDYLRDNMVLDLGQCSQRELTYAIVDEVDSILIDEARTPLIISGPAEESSELYSRFAQLVRHLDRETDYEVDEKTQVAILTEEGTSKIERLANVPEGKSLYDPEHAHMVPYLDNALRAKEFFRREKEYVVREGEIIIVDEFTGRMMFGRRYSEGLHQAIEAKEGVQVRQESLTYATITFQNFFRMYGKLAGMTGTALTEREELHKIYDLEVVVLPTNVEYRARFGDLKQSHVVLDQAGVSFAGAISEPEGIKVTVYDGPNQERYYRRLDLADQIYKTEAVKFRAVADEIEATHKAGRPVLVGTAAIETSERLSALLKARKIPHSVLNAKYHEKEAIIVAQAGRPGSVTIATNMAGRGVDILLGGNGEGLARDEIRNEGLDLTEISPEAWEEAVKLARQGADPYEKYPERWAEILRDRIRQCDADRRKVYSLGGLHVIGTERHESRRIDNQLRGRAGRQGDPGSSRFYLSLEDELMRRFGGERLQPWMDRAGFDEIPLEFKMLSGLIGSIQERVEGYNFDIRKHVLEYDNVVNKQREVVYAERRKILSRTDLHDDLMKVVNGEIERVIHAYTSGYPEDWDLREMLAELRRFVPVPRSFTAEQLESRKPEEMIAQFGEWAEVTYQGINNHLGEDLYRNMRQEEVPLRQQLVESRDPFFQNIVRIAREQGAEAHLAEWAEIPLRRLPEDGEKLFRESTIEAFRLFRDRRVMIKALDEHWVRHLTDLDVLREGIGLRAVGQQNPLVAYQKEAYGTYQEMMSSVQRSIVRALFVVPQTAAPRASAAAPARSPVSVQRNVQLRASGGSANAAPPPPAAAHTGQKLGRNDPCWCNSGKKYKDCHWREDQASGIIRIAGASTPDAGSASRRVRR